LPTNTYLWEWGINKDDEWEETRIEYDTFTRKNNRRPKRRSDDYDEKILYNWQTVQRRDFKNKNNWMTPERIEALLPTNTYLWSWGRGYSDTASISTKSSIEEEKPVPNPAPRRRRPIVAPSEPKEESNHKHVESELEKYHRIFKKQKSSTFALSIKNEPDQLIKYHEIADKYDEKDPPERRPVNKIAEMLKSIKTKKKAIDLGCGKNRLRTLVPHLDWTSIDAFQLDETVIIADIGHLPFEDNSYQIAIMSRSLWAVDHMTQLKEAFRILVEGGQLIICESFNRWFTDGTNTLIQCISEAGFQIKKEIGTALESSDEVFQYIVCMKPIEEI
jgi:hypothetical protein